MSIRAVPKIAAAFPRCSATETRYMQYSTSGKTNLHCILWLYMRHFNNPQTHQKT